MSIDKLVTTNDKLKLILETWKDLSEWEKDELFKVLKKDRTPDLEKIITNEENYARIIKDLKKNHNIRAEKGKMMWHKWKMVHIDLPAVEGFEWYKFDWFFSKDGIEKKDYEANPEYEEKSYSIDDICKMLEALRKYMSLNWVDIDEHRDYHEDLKHNNKVKKFSRVWSCIREITWLDLDFYRYRLQDKNIDWENGSRAVWDCQEASYHFRSRPHGTCESNLLLKASD